MARRATSIGARERWWVFAALAAVSLTLAAGFAYVGAWLVLPYSLLELTVLAGAFFYIERRAGDWERLSVAGDTVTVERSLRGKIERRVWNRYWLRVETTQDRFGEPARIVLEGAGERFEFGGLLPQGERGAVARDLRRVCGANAAAASAARMTNEKT
jgi:uncharacterized membrane protein